MNFRCVVLLFVAAMIASCSEKSAPDRHNDGNTSQAHNETVRESKTEDEEREGELQPPEDKIGEDCVAFVRSTKVIPAQAARRDCPGCPAGGTDVLSFRQMKTDSVSCSGDTCTIVVAVRAVFNPGAGETIAGGMTAWIPPEQRTAYLRGQTPAGEQLYRIQITYKRGAAGWKAIEFDRAPAE